MLKVNKLMFIHWFPTGLLMPEQLLLSERWNTDFQPERRGWNPDQFLCSGLPERYFYRLSEICFLTD